MQSNAVIEIPSGSESELPADLIEAAYLASTTRPVIFIVPAEMRRLVDRLLDPIVASAGTGKRGIVYIGAEQQTAVLTALTTSDCIVPATPALSARCRELGIPILTAASATSTLRRLAAGDSRSTRTHNSAPALAPTPSAA
ncbi:MAG TPA: hypothetical protein VMM18_13080 [Gemmatimonadaceae bacterium]|nr:hypothetical protein [Gemmatimonadaceae bacterium]